MTYEERAHRRIEAVRRKEEELLRLERARYSVQELMYEAEEVLRAAVQRAGRSGLPPAMSKAVERAFASVSDAVRTVEVADLRSTFRAHPESRRASPRPSPAEAEVAPAPTLMDETAPAGAGKRAPRAAAPQRKPRGAEDTEQAPAKRSKGGATEGRKARAGATPSPEPEGAEPASAEPPKAVEKPRRPRKPAAHTPEEQPQLPLVDLPAPDARQADSEAQPATRRERRKAPVAVG